MGHLAAAAPPTRAELLTTTCAGLAGVGVTLVAARAIGLHAPPCPVRWLAGVPCPGCGMTRVADAIVHGQLSAAFAADPAAVGLVAMIAVLAIADVARRVRRRPPPRWAGALPVTGALILLALAHWITTIINGGITSV